MEPHIVELPRRIVIGKGVIEGLEKDYTALGFAGRPLIVVDEITLKIAGERAAESLSRWEPRLERVYNSTVEEVERISGLVEDCKCIISVGGGTVIDVGKMAAFRRGLPFISVPTAPSHDGIAASNCSLTQGNKRFSMETRAPIAFIADIDILKNAPYKLIASGAADEISNLTALVDWKLAREKGEYYSKYAASLAKFSAEMVISSAKHIREVNEDGIRNLIEALLTSSIAMSIAGSSRPASGSEHAFSHALDSIGSKSLHGEQCGLGSILMAHHQGEDWERIREALRGVGAPTTAKEIGIHEDQLIEALVKARDVRDRYTILNEKPLDSDKAMELAKSTGVMT
jgi:glycerol-1-phosphate dehydrogenase [NAD(P)+]